MIRSNDLRCLSLVTHFKNVQAFLLCFPKCPSFSTIKSYAANVAFYQLLPFKFNYHVLVKRVFFLLNAALSVAILDFICWQYLNKDKDHG